MRNKPMIGNRWDMKSKLEIVYMLDRGYRVPELFKYYNTNMLATELNIYQHCSRSMYIHEIKWLEREILIHKTRKLIGQNPDAHRNKGTTFQSFPVVEDNWSKVFNQPCRYDRRKESMDNKWARRENIMVEMAYQRAKDSQANRKR